MKDCSKYQGIFPAFYACYEADDSLSPERVRALTEYLIGKGVTGLYVGGSSGECIYHSVAERKLVLENVMAAAKGRIVIIAHVACNNTADSMALAAHAESLGVDAIAAIPPIYFHLPPYAVAEYWNDISSAAPQTDFIIYNIPQLAGVALSSSLLREMLKNPNVIGVKNSSMPVQDIEMWRDEGAIVFELYLKIYELVQKGEIAAARPIQDACCHIIYKMCSCHGNMYAAIKEILRVNGGPDIGGVRKPLAALTEADLAICREAAADIRAAIEKFC